MLAFGSLNPIAMQRVDPILPTHDPAANVGATEGTGSLAYLHALIPKVPDMPPVRWDNPPIAYTTPPPRALWDRLPRYFACPDTPPPPDVAPTDETTALEEEIDTMLDDLENEQLVDSLTPAEKDVLEHICGVNGVDSMIEVECEV